MRRKLDFQKAFREAFTDLLLLFRVSSGMDPLSASPDSHVPG